MKPLLRVWIFFVGKFWGNVLWVWEKCLPLQTENLFFYKSNYHVFRF